MPREEVQSGRVCGRDCKAVQKLDCQTSYAASREHYASSGASDKHGQWFARDSHLADEEANERTPGMVEARLRRNIPIFPITST